MTKTVEYAIQILVCLALAGGNPTSAPIVARNTGVPASQVSKLLNYLTLRGLTRSRRGGHGGYSLRESPETIQVGRVVELFRPTPDQEKEERSADSLLQIWRQISIRAQAEWEQLTIAELTRRTAGKWESTTLTEPKAVV